jgi:hypothetical protein
MLLTYQDQGFSPYVLSVFADAGARCSSGGEPAYEGGPGGYIFFPPAEDYKLIMPNSEPAVIEGTVASRLRNPCGLLPSLAGTITLNFTGAQTHVTGLGEIEVPVMLALGERDPVLTEDGFRQQVGHFSGSDDVTSFLIDGSGHFPAARSRPGAAGRRDRRPIRDHPTRDLPAPESAQGGGAGQRAARRNTPAVSHKAGAARGAVPVSQRILGRAARAAEDRGRARRKEAQRW